MGITDSTTLFLLAHYENLYPNFAEEQKESHHKDNKEVKEPHYEDNKEFNEWFDENHSPTKVSGVGLISSRALFDNNEGVYKSYLLGYKCRDKLIERLRASPNFATTHEVVAALSRYMDFSSFQIRRIWQAYMGNAQIFWISSDSDIKCFFETTILGNSNLFSQEEINKFSDTFSCYSE